MNMMREGGLGGANTQTGTRYEKTVDLLDFLKVQPGYEVKNGEVLFQGQKVAEIFKKQALKAFLERWNIDWKKRVSSLLRPDNCLYVPKTNTIFIIECKTQNVKGSVDEKLQTCRFKLYYYKKLLKNTGLNIKYYFVLNSKWFKDKKKYQDIYKYIRKTPGCAHFFDEIPMEVLGLPTL